MNVISKSRRAVILTSAFRLQIQPPHRSVIFDRHWIYGIATENFDINESAKNKSPGDHKIRKNY